jgi:hypothetical protein
MKRFGFGTFASLLIWLAASICIAQMQVQSRIDTRMPGTGTDATVRYSKASTSRMMPSEIRHEYYDSGLLPSEIRGNYMRLGPMTPEGQSAYFAKPGGTSPSAGRDTRIDNRVDTHVQSQTLSVPPSAVSSASVGSVRYSNEVPSTAVTDRFAQGPGVPVGSMRYDSRVW